MTFLRLKRRLMLIASIVRAAVAAPAASSPFTAIAQGALQAGCRGLGPLSAPVRLRTECTKDQLDKLLAEGLALRKTGDSSGDGLLALLKFFRAGTLEELHKCKKTTYKVKAKDPEDFVSPGYLGLFEWFNNVSAETQIQAQRGDYVGGKGVPPPMLRASKLLFEAGQKVALDVEKMYWSSVAPVASIPDSMWLRWVIGEGAKLQQYLGYPERWDDMHVVGARAGIWPSRWQRPGTFMEGLRAIPVWDMAEFSASTLSLENQKDFATIQKESLAELRRFLEVPEAERPYNTPLRVSTQLPKVEAINKFNADSERMAKSGEWITEERGLHYARSWHELQLISGGKRTPACRRMPETCALLEKCLPAASRWKKGGAKLSAMGPGTEVLPHTGSSNDRLRLHMGIQIPAGAILRVADRNYTWQEGRILIFDDSFEHQVWQSGDGFRVVLNIDLPHPDLTEQQLEGAFVKRKLTAGKSEL